MKPAVGANGGDIDRESKIRAISEATGADPAALRGLRMLKVDEVSALLGEPRQRIYSWARQGVLPCVKFGRWTRWSLAAVQEFIARGGTQ